jgi:hypothetical protein
MIKIPILLIKIRFVVNQFDCLVIGFLTSPFAVRLRVLHFLIAVIGTVWTAVAR